MNPRFLLAIGLVVASCGSDAVADDDAVETVSAPTPTVAGVGELPDTVPTLPASTSTSTTSEPLVVETLPLENEDGAEIQLIGERVDGNRLLVIGDSIMASTATRFGREMCDALNPLGWSVEVDAEPGRFVEFGLRVLNRRLPDGLDPDPEDDWDAAIVHLGSNYDLDQNNYLARLNEILFQLAPRPTLLYTVTEYRGRWSEVNAVIRELAEIYENVTLIDWEFAARSPGVLSSDGLHPTNAGEDVLVGLATLGLGEFDGPEGECLRSSFTDDSAIGRGGGSPNGSSSSSSSSSTSGSSSSSSSGSSTSGSSTSSTSGGTSATTGGTTTLPGTSTGGGTTTLPGTTTGGTTTLPGTTTGGDTGTGTTTTTGGTDSTTGGTGATTGGTTGETTGTTGGTTGETTGGSTGTTDTTGGSTGTTDTTGGSTGTTDTTGGSTGTTDTTGGSTGTTDTTGGSTGTTDTTGTTGGSGATTGTTGGSDASTTGATTSTTGTTGTTGGATSGGTTTGATGTTGTTGTTGGGTDTTGATTTTGGGTDTTDTTGTTG